MKERIEEMLELLCETVGVEGEVRIDLCPHRYMEDVKGEEIQV